MWKFFNDRRAKAASDEIKLYMSVGIKQDDDISVAIIEDDSLIIEDTLSRDIREGMRSLNSPGKENKPLSNTKSREATQDVNELAKKFVHKILSTPGSPCYNSMSAEMRNHAVHYFEIKKFGK